MLTPPDTFFWELVFNDFAAKSPNHISNTFILLDLLSLFTSNVIGCHSNFFPASFLLIWIRSPHEEYFRKWRFFCRIDRLYGEDEFILSLIGSLKTTELFQHFNFSRVNALIGFRPLVHEILRSFFVTETSALLFLSSKFGGF